MKRLFLIDAYALIFRYYYAFMGRPMRNRDGFNTSVVFGFAKFLRDLLKRENPDLLGVAFDPAGGSFRREIFPEYKANRSATPEDIILSVPYVKRLMEAMCIPILEVAGFEADDVIGTLSAKGESAGYQVFMVTPDKDYGQLVTDNCSLYRQKGDDIEIVDKAAIKAKYGIDDPRLVRDILALWGDASDNIPGVEGIGEKGACKLVQSWGAVENILDNVSQIKGKQGERLAASSEKLRLSKVLTTIRMDVPIELDEELLTICEPRIDELTALYREMGFTSMLRELGASATIEPVKATTSAKRSKAEAALVGQGDLFAISMPEESAPEVVAESENKCAATTPHIYRTIKGAAELSTVIEELSRAGEFSFDTETMGLDPLRDDIVGMSFACKAHEAWYLPMGKDVRGEYVELLQPLFENESIAKIGQNIKFDILVLSRIGIEVKGRLIDTMLLHYLLDAEGRHNMNIMSINYLGYAPIEIETLIGKGAKQLTMDMVGIDKITEYAAEDADITLQLKSVLYAEVEKQGMISLYNDIEEPMIGVLARMEMSGVTIDKDSLAEYSRELTARQERLERDIREEADEPNLNINSSIQLGELLFAKLKIAAKPKLTKTKRYCTDEEYLQSFAGHHPIVDKILEYRGLRKLLSTYIDALPLLINPATGRIHSTYNQAVTATGRLSSTNPNLQNIPIREAIGRPIRAAFVPSSDDGVIVSADYSQVELRIMAHMADDGELIEAFKAGADIHAATAAKLYGLALEDVTSEQRRRAKTANFGIIYGISTFGLSQRLDIPMGEAKEIIDGYFASYSGVKSYMDRVMSEAQGSGYVETLFGRRRYLDGINSQNRVVRGVAERNAINAPIQGSAADIMKLAMVAIDRRFRAEGLQSRMIMQVHDEVVIDCLKSEQERVCEILVAEMEGAAQLKVELKVECGVGENWLEAH